MLPLASFPAPVVGHTASAHLLGWSGAGVLAHQGGWDEILMVLVPVSLFAALLYVANQRATRLAARETSSTADGGDAATAGGTIDPGSVGDGGAAGAVPPAAPPRAAPKNERRGPV